MHKRRLLVGLPPALPDVQPPDAQPSALLAGLTELVFSVTVAEEDAEELEEALARFFQDKSLDDIPCLYNTYRTVVREDDAEDYWENAHKPGENDDDED